MTTQGHGPLPDLKRLTPIPMDDIVVGFVASQREGRCDKFLAIAALSPILSVETALAQLNERGLIDERDGRLFASKEALAQFTQKYSDASGGWTAVRERLALRACSASTAKQNRALAEDADLLATALRQVYRLDELAPFPTRAEVRCALLVRAVKTSGQPFAQLLSAPQKTFKFDALSRSLYLTWAGLKTGTVGQADAHVLRKAFQFKAMSELPSAILRAAVASDIHVSTPAQPQTQPQPQPIICAPIEVAPDRQADIDAFAQSIRKLAVKLETKPYAGRVAIAQVYDEGIAQGLGLGSLDDFKKHLAEAAREGLLDLERYDIAGPLDAALRERSRLRLGRDERHFIVNQWI